MKFSNVMKTQKRTISQIINNSYVFSVISKVISVLLGIVYSILFSRYLGKELRGEASIIINYSTMISLILCLGIYQAYPFFKKEYKKDIYLEYINYIFGLFILYILFGSIFVFLAKPNIRTITIIILSPVMMATRQLNYVVLIENPKIRNASSIRLDFFDVILLAGLMIFTKANYFMCILFLLIKYIVFLIVGIKILGIKISNFKPKLNGIGRYAKYGFIPMLTIILMEINYKVDIIMLEQFNISISEIGIYSLGVMLAEKLWMIPDALKDILLSKLTKGKNEEEVSKITSISFWLMLLMIIGMIVFGKQLIRIMYGNEYVDAYSITIIILAGALGMIFYKMIYSYNVANGHKYINFILLVISAAVNVLLNAILIPIYRSIGAAIASLVSYSLCGGAFLLYFCVTAKVKLKDMLFIKKGDLKKIRSLVFNKRFSD